MFSSFFLNIFLYFLAVVYSGTITNDLKSRNEQDFWNMPKNHPLRKELTRDPGILLGEVNATRQGNFTQSKSDEQHSLSKIHRERKTPVRSLCYIEYRKTVTHPGRCIKLGDNTTPACRSKDYISINYNECN